MNAKTPTANDYAVIANLACVLKIWPQAAASYHREQECLRIGDIGYKLDMTDQERRRFDRDQADHLHNSNAHLKNCEEMYAKKAQLVKAIRLRMPDMARKVIRLYEVVPCPAAEYDWTTLFDELRMIAVEAGILFENANASPARKNEPWSGTEKPWPFALVTPRKIAIWKLVDFLWAAGLMPIRSVDETLAHMGYDKIDALETTKKRAARLVIDTHEIKLETSTSKTIFLTPLLDDCP